MNPQNGDPLLTLADGINRRHFTVAKLEAMAEAGILGPDAQLRLDAVPGFSFRRDQAD